MDEFAIDEAAGLVLENGMKFGDTSEGQVVLEMARKFLAAKQGELMRPQAPCNRFIVRKEDMSVSGRLRLLRQEDGDMCVSVIEDDGNQASVEFCAPVSGGGKSPKTLAALRALALAMMEDNQHDPSRAGER
ncbi:MAG: hypothetical protein FD131_4991 [Rhodocyclaceae bacterium]|nr:MAG: hypothetical protein FD131_4991 [Rhodocyclaceae bacterium]